MGQRFLIPLKLETRFAGRIRERLHAPVELETGTVERHLAHARCLGALGDGTADGLGRLDIARRFQTFADLLLNRGGGGNDLGARRIRHLRIDVLRGTVHAQAGDAQIAYVRTGFDGAPQTALFLRRNHFFLPSLRVICSPAYFTPLPL